MGCIAYSDYTEHSFVGRYLYNEHVKLSCIQQIMIHNIKREIFLYSLHKKTIIISTLL